MSKTFAGGFGGAGSIYTHSHLTNARKNTIALAQAQGTNQRRGQPAPAPRSQAGNRWQGGVRAIQNGALGGDLEVDARQRPESIGSNDLIVAGNRAGMPEYFI